MWMFLTEIGNSLYLTYLILQAESPIRSSEFSMLDILKIAGEFLTWKNGNFVHFTYENQGTHWLIRHELFQI